MIYCNIMDLELLANNVGFGSFKGMIMYFAFLSIIGFLGYGIYIGQKGSK